MNKSSTKYTLGDDTEEQNRLREQLALYGDTNGLSFPARARVCELGCGAGANLVWLPQQVTDYVGIDSSPEQLQGAMRLSSSLGLSNTSFILGDAAATSLSANSFDVVFIRLLLVHLSNPEAVIAEASRLLRSGGLLVIIEPDDTSVFAGPNFYNLVTLWQTKAIYSDINYGTVARIGCTLLPLLKRQGFRDTTVTPITVAKIEEDARTMAGNWLQMILRVKEQLLKSELCEEEQFSLAEKEIANNQDGLATLTLWRWQAVKP